MEEKLEDLQKVIEKVKEKKFMGIRDSELPYPGKKNTGQPIRDGIYNWIVKRYVKNKHIWHKSDENVFGGFLYFILDYFIMVLWIWFFYFVINMSLKNYGFEKAVFVAVIFVLIRMNAMIKQLVQLNKNMKGD